jgi:hypothetical protein
MPCRMTFVHYIAGHQRMHCHLMLLQVARMQLFKAVAACEVDTADAPASLLAAAQYHPIGAWLLWDSLSPPPPVRASHPTHVQVDGKKAMLPLRSRCALACTALPPKPPPRANSQASCEGLPRRSCGRASCTPQSARRQSDRRFQRPCERVVEHSKIPIVVAHRARHRRRELGRHKCAQGLVAERRVLHLIFGMHLHRKRLVP